MIRKIPLHAKVMCSDGLAGESISVVINPATRSVTHLVVQDKTFPKPIEWLVPVEKASDSNSGIIQLDCTREELSKMQPFRREHYLEQEYADYDYAYNLPHMLTPANMQYTPLDELNISSESFAVHRGADVEALDGHGGKIGELLLDTQSGRITHIVLMRGHLFGKKESVLPLTLIEHADPEAVYLKVDTKFIEDLPSLPVNRPWKEINAADLELMAWRFNGMLQADEALKLLKDLESTRQIVYLNIAIITKALDGKVALQEIKEIDTRRGTLSGANTGGLVGLLIGPGGAIVGAAAGAAAGKKSAKKVEVGVSNDKLKAFQDAMAFGSSAIIILVEHRWYEAARQALAGFDHEFFHQRLTELESDQPQEECKKTL